jgi:phosphoadenosine phosphosulfate reductase
MTELESKVKAIEAQLSSWRDENRRFFATSSFQTSSGVLLHLLDRFAPGISVCFLNTSYHFPETLMFRRELGARFDLNIVDVFSPISRIQQQRDGQQLFAADPDLCCHLNKVLPLEPWLASNDFWINGIRGDQSAHRSTMTAFSPAAHGCRRWHPLLDWTDTMMDEYRATWSLPSHPLDPGDGRSIGCQPCTAMSDSNQSREGRWHGLKKTECGLHLTIGAS